MKIFTQTECILLSERCYLKDLFCIIFNRLGSHSDVFPEEVITVLKENQT